MSGKINSQAAGRAGAQVQPPPKPLARILVVEDEADIRRLNAEVLRRFGYQVDTVEDGAAAWEALQLHSYDLLVTDNKMPNVTGIELLEKLHTAHIALPVIMASGMMPKEQLIVRPWLQIQAMLIKPYTIDELLGAVKNVLVMCATNGAEGQGAPPNWRPQLLKKNSPLA